jgi:hypothetical protein
MPIPVLDLPRAVLPDYDGGSLLNLIASIAHQKGGVRPDRLAASGSRTHMDLSSARVVVFLLIDGLGANDIARRGKGAFVADHQRATLTSVFPSTTAAAITTSMTGLSPAAHGLTGWHIRDPRFGGILAPLPMVRRDREPMPGWWKLPRLFPYPSLFQRMKCRSAIVSHEHILGSPFNMRHSRGVSRRYGYQRIEELAPTIVSAARDLGGEGGIVYAYHGDYDALAHGHGIGSGECAAHYERMDEALKCLAQALAGQDVALMVSADHGFINSPPECQLRIEDLPELHACLDGPLWGEWRVAYCRIKPGHHERFETAVSRHLAGRFDLVRGADLVASGVFGPAARAHRRLAERVGDYALIARDDWTIHDRIANESEHRMLGVHAGVSADEMLIPLVLKHC